MQQEVYESLHDRSILQPLSTEEFEYILSGNGMMMGAYVENELIAFRALLNPPIEEEHLGYDCGIAEDQFIEYYIKKYRMSHRNIKALVYKKKLAKVVMNHIDLASYDYVCSTVKPYNIPSLKDKFSQGLVIKGLKIKYVDKLRYIFYKDLHHEQPIFSEKKSLPMGDTNGQQILLKQGYLGTSIYEEQHDWFVVYEK